MHLERFTTGRTHSNAYVLAPVDRRAVIVDPGFGADRPIVRNVEEQRLTPEVILLTHGHPDHIWTARRLAGRYAIPAYVHDADLPWFDDPATGGTLPLVRLGGRLLGSVRRLRPDDLRHAEREIAAAGTTFRVLPTPGHTPGGVCYRADPICFTGDTVFRGTVGHTHYPGSSRRALMESIRRELLPLPDEIRLLPGHGTETTVGAERAAWEGD